MFLEIGPSPTLVGLGRRCLPAGTGLWLPSLRAGRGDWTQLLESVAALAVRGVAVDFEALDRPYDRRRVVLPTYPFERERFWLADTPDWGAASGTRKAPASDVEDLLYEVAWREQPGAETSAPAAERIAARVLPAVGELAARNGMARYDAMLPELDRAAGVAVVAAFRALGWPVEAGEQVVAGPLMERLGIQPRCARLVGRLLEMLGEDGILAPHGSGWQVARTPPEADPAGLWDALLAGFAEHGTEIRLARRCTEGLAAVLRGEADPLHVLFPGGSLDEAEQLYGTTPVALTYNALVRDAVAAAIAGLPEGRPLRILEIGAGTGSTTAAVLPVLPAERTTYVFTDVSPLFAQRARERFATFGFVEHRTLDITRDPKEQGFAAGGFDIVIAANVLHATPDLRQSLAHVRRLLAPEGLLVLYEAMGRQRFSDLTVGLTDGWWSFTDTALRPAYALLSHESWRSLLAEEGFAGATALPDEHAPGVLSQQALVLARAQQSEASCWLVLADRGGLGERLGEAIRASGGRCIVAAEPGEIPAEVDAVVHLASLDSGLGETTTAEDLAAAQRRITGGVLQLAQKLARRGGTARLWLVTRGAQPAGGAAPADPVQATVWGLSHTLALEHPELRCTRIDLGHGDAGEEVARLMAELRRPGAEDQIALRGAHRYVRRLTRAAWAAQAGEPLRFRADASYLITGGLGGVGLEVARWMAGRGARHLVLMGRSGASPAAQTVLHGLQQRGVRIMVAQGDVADQARLQEILAQAGRDLPPLRGVMHAAGVLDDGVLLHQTWQRFEKVMAPKVMGGWHLHTLTRDLPLDFFVLFSSGVGLIGAAGQGNHAAANAFMDALAYRRRDLGLPAATINWGAWAEVGAAARHGLDAQAGKLTFAPEQGLRALEQVMRRAALAKERTVQVAVLAVDWAGLNSAGAAYGAAPLFGELTGAAPKAVRTAAPAAQERPLREQLAAALPNRRKAVLQEHVARLAATVLGVPDAARIDVGQPLQELGLDSLMAVDLRNRLGRAVDGMLPVTLLFEYPSVGALTGFLASEVLAPLGNGAEPGSARAPAEEIAEDDQIAARLLEKLDRLEAGLPSQANGAP